MKLKAKWQGLVMGAGLLAVIALGAEWWNSNRLDPVYAVATDGTPIDARSPALRIACVGDSITYGLTIPDRVHASYPADLGRWLGPGYRVFNFGVSGTTLLKNGDFPYRDEPAFQAATQCRPDIVVILLGTNDTRPRNWGLIAQFPTDYRDLIGQFGVLPSHPRIFICRPIPVVGPGLAGINESGIEAELPMIDAVANTEGVGEIDLYGAMSGHGDLQPDDIHPDAAGARVIAGAVYTALMAHAPPTT